MNHHQQYDEKTYRYHMILVNLLHLVIIHKPEPIPATQRLCISALWRTTSWAQTMSRARRRGGYYFGLVEGRGLGVEAEGLAADRPVF